MDDDLSFESLSSASDALPEEISMILERVSFEPEAAAYLVEMYLDLRERVDQARVVDVFPLQELVRELNTIIDGKVLGLEEEPEQVRITTPEVIQAIIRALVAKGSKYFEIDEDALSRLTPAGTPVELTYARIDHWVKGLPYMSEDEALEAGVVCCDEDGDYYPIEGYKWVDESEDGNNFAVVPEGSRFVGKGGVVVAGGEGGHAKGGEASGEESDLPEFDPKYPDDKAAEAAERRRAKVEGVPYMTFAEGLEANFFRRDGPTGACIPFPGCVFVTEEWGSTNFAIVPIIGGADLESLKQLPFFPIVAMNLKRFTRGRARLALYLAKHPQGLEVEGRIQPHLQSELCEKVNPVGKINRVGRVDPLEEIINEALENEFISNNQKRRCLSGKARLLENDYLKAFRLELKGLSLRLRAHKVAGYDFYYTLEWDFTDSDGVIDMKKIQRLLSSLKSLRVATFLKNEALARGIQVDHFPSIASIDMNSIPLSKEVYVVRTSASNYSHLNGRRCRRVLLSVKDPRYRTIARTRSLHINTDTDDILVRFEDDGVIAKVNRSFLDLDEDGDLWSLGTDGDEGYRDEFEDGEVGEFDDEF
jgi:hypothetical protein